MAVRAGAADTSDRPDQGGHTADIDYHYQEEREVRP